jgi:SAM-dependent methyltransferase
MASMVRAKISPALEAEPAVELKPGSTPRTQIYLGFWGRLWQESDQHKLTAAAVIDRLTGVEWRAGPLVQASYYYDNGWYSNSTAPTLSTGTVTGALQKLIGRGVAPEPDPQAWGPAAFMVLALDESIGLGGGDTFVGPHFGAFRTLLGNQFCYGIADQSREDGANVDRLSARLAALVDAMVAGSWPADGQTILPELAMADVRFRSRPSIGARNPATPFPSLFVEERVPRFRIAPEELQAWLAGQAWPSAIEEVPGIGAIFEQAAVAVEAKVMRRATRPAPASPEELRNFSSPNARVTIAERFIALRNKIGEDHPDAALLEQILAGVSEEEFARMRAAYHGNGAANFLDIVYWSYHKLNLARSFGLDTAPAMSIWDIGCGGGHFARICKYFGHNVVGTDQEHQVYGDIGAALEVERTIDLIIADKPTTDFGCKFDLITAMAVEFNHHFPRSKPPRYWTLDQWRYLLNDLMARQLKYPARIYLDLNCEHRDGKGVYNLELLRLCAANGAHSDERRGIIDWRLDAPTQV